MGMADVVPGVSGGTVALVLGIYRRLITAISHVDFQLLDYLKKREFRKAAQHLDILFLISLAVGIGLGFIITILTIAKLLSDDSTRPYVQATFFGLVLGACWIVIQMIRNHSSDNKINWIAMLIGFAIAGLISWMAPGSTNGDPGLWYIFLCGMVAICAMILPGISGALVLLLLGCYGYMVEVVKAVLHRESLATNLPIAIVFAGGCLIGLLAFSKVLRRLLDQKPGATMSLLCGLMLGSLFKLWPYQKDLMPEEEDFKHKVFQPIWPEQFDGQMVALFATALFAAAAVVFVERVGAKIGKRTTSL